MAFDPSRQADIYMLNKKLQDPTISDQERKKAENALYAIREQSQHPAIAKLRRELDGAQINGDKAKAERLVQEAQRIDRNYTN